MSRLRTKLTKQIEDVALALNKSTVTIRGWVSQGLDIFNPDEIVRWYQFKESRRRGGPRVQTVYHAGGFGRPQTAETRAN